MAIAIDRVTVVLLAAGRGERFGGDKLATPFRGRPLGEHAAAMLAALPFAAHIAVTGPSAVDLAALGFDCRRAPGDAPMSVSLKLGIAAAAEGDCDACLIALADMPLVPAAHIRALLAAHDGALTATLSGDIRMVPALIARSAFPLIAALGGDQGARALLRDAPGVAAPPAWLVDIDTPGDAVSNDQPGGR
ncbi:MAG: nucleotidyltransferase family protein [Sphingomonas bacterium]|nr:nucleotidyltransferase family protein [Sphingomonas bacterium]